MLIRPFSTAMLFRHAMIAIGIGVSGAAIANTPGVIAVASAHDAVLSSVPADGATVDAFPRKIVLEFSGIPQDSFNTIAVTNSETKAVLFSAEPSRDKQLMSVTVPDDIHPGPGHYIIGFQITSSDGHATRGKLSFTVANSQDGSTSLTSGADEPSAEVAAAAETDTTSGLSLGRIVGFMASIAILAGAFVTLKKRK